MVIWLRLAFCLHTSLLFAQQQPQSPLSRLGPRQRAQLFAALAVLITLGVLLMFLTYLGARITRRYMGSTPRSRRAEQNMDDWARKPIVPIDPDDGPAEMDESR